MAAKGYRLTFTAVHPCIQTEKHGQSLKMFKWLRKLGYLCKKKIKYQYTVKPALETTSIKRPPTFRPLLKPT